MGIHHEFNKNSRTLELIYYWYEPYHLFGLGFLLLWDIICMIFYSHIFLALVKGELSFPQNVFSAFFFFVLILAPTYWILLFFINRTKIQISRTEIIVVSGPFPSFRKGHAFATRSILNVKVVEHCINKNFENAWQAKADETCNVRATLNSGELINILENIQHKADAQIVCERINAWLLEIRRSGLQQECGRGF